MKKLVFNVIVLAGCFAIIINLAACKKSENTSAAGEFYIDGSEITISDNSDDSSSGSKTKGKSGSKKSKKSTKTEKSKKTSNKASGSGNKSGALTALKYKNIAIKKASSAAIRCVGRPYIRKEGGLVFGWSGSMAEFVLNCEGNVTFRFESLKGSGDSTVRIFVDGKKNKTDSVIKGSCDVTAAQNLSKGEHLFRIVKITDCDTPPAVLCSIVACGELRSYAPGSNKILIEAIGDNALTGDGIKYSGNIDIQKTSLPNKKYEDATLTYPYLAAEKLNADCYLMARNFAGIAATYLVKTATVNGRQETVCDDENGMFPVIYPRCFLLVSEEYDFSRRADIIVVDSGAVNADKNVLGDVLKNGKVGITRGDSVVSTVEFFNKLKEINPNAKIIWSLGITGYSNDLKQYSEIVMRNLGGSNRGFYLMTLSPSKRGLFPTESEHLAASQILYKKIKEVI